MRSWITALAGLVGTTALAAGPTTDAVLARLHARGDIGRLSAAEFDAFAGCIERGETRCIAAVARLRPSGNAIRGETIPIVLARALRTNPAAVLRLTGRGMPDYDVKTLCADNDIEPSHMSVVAFRRAAMQALARVTDPRLRVRRDACLRLIAASPS